MDPLAYIYNLSFITDKVPQSLKTAKVIPVYKKGERTSPDNYRPISLLSTFDKILEKLMHKRLHSFLQQHSILHQYQFRFRKNHSIIMALIELTDSLYSHLTYVCVFTHIFIITIPYLACIFDLQNAFDTVNREILLCKLQNYGMRGIVNQWFRDYLHNRKQFVLVGDTASDLGMINCGVPQGSELGPLLFLIYINDICNIGPHCNVGLYADDTNVFVFGKTMTDVFLKSNTIVVKLNNWFITNNAIMNVQSG